MKPAKKFQCAQVRLLHYVFRVVVVSRQPARQIVGSIDVWQDGLFKVHGVRLLVELIRGSDQTDALQGNERALICNRRARGSCPQEKERSLLS